MAYRLLTFKDIQDAVIEELKLDSNDTTEVNRIKRDINMVYINVVAPFKRWTWLQGTTVAEFKPFLANGTVAVTPDSTTVTFSVAPSTSKAGYFFKTDDFNEIYIIQSHTGGATTATLSSPYTGTLKSAATYKVWTDSIALPTDCRETVEAWHQHMVQPLTPLGNQEFRRRVSEDPVKNDRPFYYNTYDYFDPTANTDETESDRYRVMRVWPSVYQNSTTIHIDYIKEVTHLDDDNDEPIMPIEDRIVLVYGALERAWKRFRNPEAGEQARRDFEQKLAQMAGRVEDAQDTPQIVPNSLYLARKRGRTSIQKKQSAGTGGSYTAPSYLKNATIEGGTFTANMTASSGVTIDGRDLSVDGANLDAHVAASTNVHGIGASSSVVGTATSQTLTNKNIDASANTITNIADANVAASAAIAKTKLATGTAGRVEVTDGSGNLTESVVTSNELLYLDDVEPLTTAALNDNQASAANVATWAHASFSAVVVEYSIKRGSNVEVGQVMLATDGSSASIAQSYAAVGSSGVTFSTDISGADLRLRYTSTSTGTAPTMKYRVRKHLA
jgi:hypothetical protein